MGRVQKIGAMKMQALRSHMMQRVAVLDVGWVVTLVTLVVVRSKEPDDQGRQIASCRGLEKEIEGVEGAPERLEVRRLKEQCCCLQEDWQCSW